AIARIGTTRFRHGGMELLGFTPDGKALIYHGSNALHLMDVVTGKEVSVARYADNQPRAFGGFDPVLSGDTKVLAVAYPNVDVPGVTIGVISASTGKELNRFESSELFKLNHPSQ